MSPVKRMWRVHPDLVALEAALAPERLLADEVLLGIDPRRGIYLRPEAGQLRMMPKALRNSPVRLPRR